MFIDFQHLVSDAAFTPALETHIAHFECRFRVNVGMNNECVSQCLIVFDNSGV